MPAALGAVVVLLTVVVMGGQRAAVLRSFNTVVSLETTSEDSANVSLGDLDGDGDLDIVLAKGRHTPLLDRVLINDGKGGFVASDLGPTPDRTYTAALADLDGDGDLDVLTSNDTPDRKLVYLNDGKGRFTVAGTWGVAEWSTRNATVADLNGDGRVDVIAANRPGPSFACLNQGGGRFANDCIRIPAESATSIVAADFDKDGFIDLAVPSRDGGQSRIYFNDGKAGFSRTTPFGPPDAAARVGAAADFNRDGSLDLAVGDEKASSLLSISMTGRDTSLPGFESLTRRERRTLLPPEISTRMAVRTSCSGTRQGPTPCFSTREAATRSPKSSSAIRTDLRTASHWAMSMATRSSTSRWQGQVHRTCCT